MATYFKKVHRAAAAASHRAGLGCLVEKKYHMKRLGTSLRGQSRVSQRRLGRLSPGPSEVRSARLFAAPDTAAVVVDDGKSKRLTAEPREQQQKNDPNTISGSDSHKILCFLLHERDFFVLEKSI